MDTATVGDVELCYRLVGQGPPLVMIIGYTASLEWWNPTLVEALSSNRQVLLFDNRGSGRSSSGSKRFTIRQFASDTAGLMDSLGIDRAEVVANSMGGMIAQELVLNFPRKVNRLVLNCTTCGGLRAKLPKLDVMKRLVTTRGTQAENVRKNIDFLFPPAFLKEHPEVLERLLESIEKAPATPESARRQAMAIAGFSTYRRLPFIKSPTLVMAGTEDILIPPENSRVLANRIPNARLRFFEGAGHRFTAQFPVEVAAEIKEFLAEP